MRVKLDWPENVETQAQADCAPGADATPGAAMDILKRAMQEDSAYAHTWHANIAMAFCDSAAGALEHKDALRIGNEGAQRFMKLAFGVETSSD